MDTHGGAASRDGSAFSGRDSSKADRSAAYMARYLAKQVVACPWSGRALVQLAYAIGVAEPVSFPVDADEATANQNTDAARDLRSDFDLTPGRIVRYLYLLPLIYYPTAAYGHFGRTDPSFRGKRWEERLLPLMQGGHDP